MTWNMKIQKRRKMGSYRFTNSIAEKCFILLQDTATDLYRYVYWYWQHSLHDTDNSKCKEQENVIFRNIFKVSIVVIYLHQFHSVAICICVRKI